MEISQQVIMNLLGAEQEGGILTLVSAAESSLD